MFKLRDLYVTHMMHEVRGRKALAPCPRCNSWNTIVENNIFVCLDCGFEG